jgi:hypothetical protein
MNTENLPAVQAQNSMMPSQQEFQMLQVIAKNAQDSGLYSGVGQQAKIFMVLLAARELGVSPMLALNGGIWNINGKIEISARLMNGLIRRAGHSIKIVISNDTHCTLLGTRSDGDSFECSFNMDDAIKAGLAGGNVWKKYPADMLYNRCMSRLARRLFSDVIGNSYVEGEIREAKDIEKLEQAECEDLTQNRPQIPKENVVNSSVLTLNEENKHSILSQEPKISFDQLTEIMIGYAKTDDIFKDNLKNYIETKYNVKEFEDLPARLFEPIMTSIKRNTESRMMVKNENN